MPTQQISKLFIQNFYPSNVTKNFHQDTSSISSYAVITQSAWQYINYGILYFIGQYDDVLVLLPTLVYYITFLLLLTL